MALSILSRHLAFNQNLVAGMVVFFSAGIYLAVLGLGAGGGKPSSQHVSDITNASLYAVFAVFGFCTGGILNKLGPKWTMAIGATGYPFYVAGLFYYDKTGGQAFPVVGGVVLGFCAPMMWTTAMGIQWSYATEIEKASYIAIQFIQNALGSIIGALVAFIIILKGAQGSGADGSPTPVYITFIILMFLGVVVAIFGLVPPKTVVRSDGSHVAVFNTVSVKHEIKAVLAALSDKRLLLMLPVAFCTEFPVSIMPILNAHYFSLRTRALNSLMFNVMLIPFTPLFMYLLDKLPVGRKMRGLVSLSVASVFIVAGWICLISWICISKTFASPPLDGVDWSDANFAGPFVLYIWFSVVFTSHQMVGMWTMASLTNDPQKLSIYAGLWRGVSAAGLCIAFGMSAGGFSYRGQVGLMMGFQILSLIIMFFIIGKYAVETNYGKEEHVVVPHYAEEKYHIKINSDELPQVLEGQNGDIENVNVSNSDSVTEKI